MVYLEALRRQLRGLRQPNFERRRLIPQRALYALMTTDVIRNAITECGISAFQLLDIIERSARKIFATLVLIGKPELITKFLDYDTVRNLPVDGMLPFPRNILESFLPESVAEEFDEQQWEIAVPVFRKEIYPIKLGENAILPFVRDREIGEGGFGVIHEVELVDGHQGEGPEVLVRKEFRPGTDSADFKKELDNLSFLNQLQHPNIIQLLSSYTYRGKHNFIFPYIRGGDLAQLLREPQRREPFQTDGAFYVALSQLSSALEMLHHFSVSGLDLELIGCHRDLKPSNILVDGARFMLADFGLSRFKTTSDDSKTIFNDARGPYVAPECENIENFQKFLVGRASDIWSFGCILAEVATYMVFGAEGVVRFQEHRGFDRGPFRHFLFHCGPNCPNETMHYWLNGLEARSSHPGQTLVQLVRRMLVLEPEKRITIGNVTKRLRRIAVEEGIKLAEEPYQRIDQSGLTAAAIERERFTSWVTAIRSQETEIDVLSSDSVFWPTLNILSQIAMELNETEYGSSPAENCMCPRLRFLNDRLIGHLPVELQEQAKRHFELILLETNDNDILQETQLMYENVSHSSKIGMLAAIKRISRLAKSLDPQTELEIDPQKVEYAEDLEEQTLAWIKGDDGTRSNCVLIEWEQYDSTWAGSVAAELVNRVKARAALLNSTQVPGSFLSLRCMGWYHAVERGAFGLVFEYPYSCDVTQLPIRPVTLASLIENTQGRPKVRLGDRFQLAHKLATSVLDFHKIKWLHRTVSSYNVIFFARRISDVGSLKHPFLIGFNNSRPDKPSEFSMGPYRQSKHQGYQESEYVNGKTAYLQTCDYYSLGVVLLEIGLWKPVASMLNKAILSDLYGQKKLLDRLVPDLGYHVGIQYQTAVEACLLGKLESRIFPGDKKRATAISLLFGQLVVDRLAKCAA